MTYSAKQLTEALLSAYWKRHDAQDRTADCTQSQMDDITEEINDLEFEAEAIGIDPADVEQTFRASLDLSGVV